MGSAGKSKEYGRIPHKWRKIKMANVYLMEDHKNGKI